MHNSPNMCRGDMSCPNVLDFHFEYFWAERAGDNRSKPVWRQRTDKTHPRTHAVVLAKCRSSRAEAQSRTATLARGYSRCPRAALAGTERLAATGQRRPLPGGIEGQPR